VDRDSATKPGIRAFADEQKPLSAGDFIGRWMAQIAPAAAGLEARGTDRDDYLRRLERAAVELSLTNLMTFPFVRRRVEAGELALHGAYFGVATGRLLLRDPATGEFAPMEAEAAEPPGRRVR